MQRDGGFAASRRALHHQMGVQGMADHDVLFRLDGGHNFPQAVCGDAAQYALEVRFLGDDAAVEEADQFPLLHGQHPLQGQFALHAAVRRLVIHLSDLAGVIEIGDRRTPIHYDGCQRHGIQHAPTAQVPGFR